MASGVLAASKAGPWPEALASGCRLAATAAIRFYLPVGLHPVSRSAGQQVQALTEWSHPNPHALGPPPDQTAWPHFSWQRLRFCAC